MEGNLKFLSNKLLLLFYNTSTHADRIDWGDAYVYYSKCGSAK